MSRFRALWQASLNATKSALAWNPEDLIPPTKRYIFNFNSKEELNQWDLYSDSKYGGLLSASLEIVDSGNESSGTGVFSGNLSVDIAGGSKWRIARIGFCGMRSTKIPLARYLPTWRGNVIEADLEMIPARVVGVSLSANAIGGVPGAQTGPGKWRGQFCGAEAAF